MNYLERDRKALQLINAEIAGIETVFSRNCPKANESIKNRMLEPLKREKQIYEKLIRTRVDIKLE